MGVKAVPPMPPSDEMLKVAPFMSAGDSLRSRALAASSPISVAIWLSPFLSASRSTGTTRPLGVSTAMPMCT